MLLPATFNARGIGLSCDELAGLLLLATGCQLGSSRLDEDKKPYSHQPTAHQKCLIG